MDTYAIESNNRDFDSEFGEISEQALNFLEEKSGISIVSGTSSDISEKTGCVPGGTLISMADGNLKKIEDVEIGDRVLSYDLTKKDFVFSTVDCKKVTTANCLYEINDGLISLTDDHPVYVKKTDGSEGWAAINPETAKFSYENLEVFSLEVGDKVFTDVDEWFLIKDIKTKKYETKVYTLGVDSAVHNFFAGHVLISNANERYILSGYREGVNAIYGQSHTILSLKKVENLSSMPYDTLRSLVGISSNFHVRITVKIEYGSNDYNVYTSDTSSIAIYQSEVSSFQRKNVLIWDGNNREFYYGWLTVEVFAF